MFVILLAPVCQELLSQQPEPQPPSDGWRIVQLAPNRMHPLRKAGWVGSEHWSFVSPLENGIATASRVVYRSMAGDGSNHQLVQEGRILDASGTMLETPVFEDIEAFREGLAAVKLDGQWGFIDRDLKMVIAPQFDAVLGFLHGWSPASKKGKWGFIDRKGKWVLQPAWDEVRAFPLPGSESLARARKDKLWGFINRQGKWAIPAQYDAVLAFNAASTLVREPSNSGRSGLWKLVDPTGKTLSDERWRFSFGFPLDGLAVASVETQDGRWGYLKPNGSYLLPPQWEKAMPFKDGSAVAWRDGKAGVIGENGDWIIRPDWDHLTGIAEGFVVARRGELHGYIEIATGRVIEPQWHRVEPFEDGLGLVLDLDQDMYTLIGRDGAPAAQSFSRWPSLSELPKPTAPGVGANPD